MIAETELQLQATQLLDIYRIEFEAITGRQPFLDVSNDTHNLKKLIRDAGSFEYACEIVRGYFKSKNEWVKENGFPIPYMVNNKNSIVANLPPDHKKSVIKNAGLKMRITFYCDDCEASFIRDVPMDFNFDNKILCAVCEENPAVSKEWTGNAEENRMKFKKMVEELTGKIAKRSETLSKPYVITNLEETLANGPVL